MLVTHLLVVFAEKLVRVLIDVGHVPAHVTRVEAPRLDVNPLEVAHQLVGDVGLAPGRQTHHGNHVLGRNVRVAGKVGGTLAPSAGRARD